MVHLGVILVNFHKRQIESLPFGSGSREEENVGEMATSHICKNDYIILNENAALLTSSTSTAFGKRNLLNKKLPEGHSNLNTQVRKKYLL